MLKKAYTAFLFFYNLENVRRKVDICFLLYPRRGVASPFLNNFPMTLLFTIHRVFTADSQERSDFNCILTRPLGNIGVSPFSKDHYLNALR